MSDECTTLLSTGCGKVVEKMGVTGSRRPAWRRRSASGPLAHPQSFWTRPFLFIYHCRTGFWPVVSPWEHEGRFEST